MNYKRFILCVILLQVNSSKCFQCPGYEIPRKFRCDGINNCGDNSDEDGCPNFYADNLEEDEITTREAELESQIAQLEQMLSEAELAKEEVQNQLEQVQIQCTKSSMGSPIGSILDEEETPVNITNENDSKLCSDIKEELEELKKTTKQELSEVELAKKEAENQLKQVQAQLEKSLIQCSGLENEVFQLKTALDNATSEYQIAMGDQKMPLENECLDLKEELDEMKNTLKPNLSQGLTNNLPLFPLSYPFRYHYSTFFIPWVQQKKSTLPPSTSSNWSKGPSINEVTPTLWMTPNRKLGSSSNYWSTNRRLSSSTSYWSNRKLPYQFIASPMVKKLDQDLS